MNGRRRYLLILLVVLLVLAVPSAVLANKVRYKAILRNSAGLQKGSADFMFTPSTLAFQAVANNLTSPATGIVLEEVDGTYLLTLCGNPLPSATGAACPSSNPAAISGTIAPGLLQGAGLTGGQFYVMLNNGDVWVNVYSANGSEARGQLIKQ